MALAFVALVMGFGGFYLLVVLLEQLVAEVELVIYLVFSLEVFVKTVSDFIDYALSVRVGGAVKRVLLFGLVLLAFSLVRKHFVAYLDLLEYLL